MSVLLYTTEDGKSQLTLKREKVVVFSRPPIVNRTARESLFSLGIREQKIKLNPPVQTHASVKTIANAPTTKYNNPPRASVIRIYIIFFSFTQRNLCHTHARRRLRCLRVHVCVGTNIYLLIIYAKAPPRTDVPPFRTVAHKSLSALAKDSPGNLYARRDGVAFEPETHIIICIYT